MLGIDRIQRLLPAHPHKFILTADPWACPERQRNLCAPSGSARGFYCTWSRTAVCSELANGVAMRRGRRGRFPRPFPPASVPNGRRLKWFWLADEVGKAGSSRSAKAGVSDGAIGAVQCYLQNEMVFGEFSTHSRVIITTVTFAVTKNKKD